MVVKGIFEEPKIFKPLYRFLIIKIDFIEINKKNRKFQNSFLIVQTNGVLLICIHKFLSGLNYLQNKSKFIKIDKFMAIEKYTAQKARKIQNFLCEKLRCS